MELGSSAEIGHWRGPSPHPFATVPAEECSELDVGDDVSGRLAVRPGGLSSSVQITPVGGGGSRQT